MRALDNGTYVQCIGPVNEHVCGQDMHTPGVACAVMADVGCTDSIDGAFMSRLIGAKSFTGL